MYWNSKYYENVLSYIGHNTFKMYEWQWNERKSEKAHIPHAPTMLENAVYNKGNSKP